MSSREERTRVRLSGGVSRVRLSGGVSRVAPSGGVGLLCKALSFLSLFCLVVPSCL